jgi:hypothetical protein
MPLLKGTSPQVEEQNFHEFRHGKTFAHTAAKFGKARAMAQMEAVVLKSAGKSKYQVRGHHSLKVHRA